MKDTLRLGIVGCGDISRFTALGCLLNPRLKAAVCVDTDEQRAAAFARRFRIPRRRGDYFEMLDEDEIDAVYLAVPHALHHPFMKAALEKGLPVLCEKPLTATLEEGLDIVDRAQKAGIKIGINYQYRYDRAMYALVTVARSGDLGRLLYGRCHIPWHREPEYFTNSPWHADPVQSGGGTLITQGSHFLDAALTAFPSPPVAVTGTARRFVFSDVGVEDFFSGEVEMEDGSLLQITSSMVSNPQRPASVELYGTVGTGIYRDALSGKLRFFGTRPRRRQPPAKGLHALFRSLEGFRRWVIYDEPYMTPVEEALPVLAVIRGLYTSAKTGTRERVDRRYENYRHKVV